VFKRVKTISLEYCWTTNRTNLSKNSMRTFIAIFPPDELLKEFEKIQSTIKSKYSSYLRFVKPVHFHISMRFLGELHEKEGMLLADELAKNLSTVKSFNVQLHEVAFGFRAEGYPRILFVSVRKATGLSTVSRAIDASIKDTLVHKPFEDLKSRETIYHITLARKKRRIPKRVIKNIKHYLTKISLWEGFRVDTVYLMKSELSTEGSKYTSIARFSLV
jgi:2'-5' RNA ligase